MYVISVVDFIRTGRPPPGSVWVDPAASKKVPVEIKLLVMNVDSESGFSGGGGGF